MATGIELERIQRRSGGRVHLIPHVPGSGVAVTLCEQRLADGTYRATEAEADCRNCIRRQDDPARVSGAFFQSELGSELLARSLAEARARGPRQPRPAPAPAEKPAAGPAPARAAAPGAAPRPQEGAAPRIAGLRSPPPLRREFENVYVSPAGVMIRLAPDGTLAHVTFNGQVELRRRGPALTIRIGDLHLDLGA